MVMHTILNTCKMYRYLLMCVCVCVYAKVSQYYFYNNVTWIGRNLPTSLPRSSSRPSLSRGCLCEPRDYCVENTRPEKLENVKIDGF